MASPMPASPLVLAGNGDIEAIYAVSGCYRFDSFLRLQQES
jgi:hypothetical protein